MLTEFRAAVYDRIETALGVPVWDVVPDDPAELPCVVVGRPGAVQTATAVVFDMALEVTVLGRRTQAGGSEPELSGIADAVWLLFNGTRAVNHQGHSLAVRGVYPRSEVIAALDYPAYVLSVESSIATC